MASQVQPLGTYFSSYNRRLRAKIIRFLTLARNNTYKVLYTRMTNEQRAKKARLTRLYKRIYNLLLNNYNNCLFITFTFSNKVLENTKEQTRLRYIKAYLNEQTNEYILNKDYGKTNEREHYHAIATPNNHIIQYGAYKIGHINAERINQLQRFTRNNKTLEEIAHDLTIHATKQSTKESKIIYSRKPRNTRKNTR